LRKSGAGVLGAVLGELALALGGLRLVGALLLGQALTQAPALGSPGSQGGDESDDQVGPHGGHGAMLGTT
jgi:hypothetical protein